MKLELFNFIDETIAYFSLHKAGYEYVMGQLRYLYINMMQKHSDIILDCHCRIKGVESLKEKLIRNKFYLQYEAGEDAVAHLSDLVGITIQCRFIRNENELYQGLLTHFDKQGKDGYAKCLDDDRVYLNLAMPQPQYQRNGFTIYRIDGYYLFNGNKINYELQIKSLVHNFWSEIEHQVVYKNPEFVVYDRFNKSMLGAIRDNLDVVDRQLEIMYDEISEQSKRKQIGMDEKGFKLFVARSVNDLVNKKMIESVGFTTDFKKCSAILAQYIYIRDFVNGEHNREMMVDYLEHLNYLSEIDLDMKEEIFLEKPYTSDDPFCDILGRFWVEVMNKDFQWHIFFAMLFSLQPGNNYEDLNDFVHVIRMLIVQPGWFEDTFSAYDKTEAESIRRFFLTVAAKAIADEKVIEMVHEEKLLNISSVFRRFVEFCEEKYHTVDDFMEHKEAIETTLTHQISVVFK